MKILEFVEKYCADIVQNFKDSSNLIDWTILPYDEKLEIDGKMTPVVYIDSQPVQVQDFVAMEKSEFTREHPTPSAGEAFDNYIDGLEIIEGPEFLTYLQNKMRAAAKKVEDDSEAYSVLC